MHRIIHGDMLKVLPTLPRAKMIFADPPDNIGLEYDNGLSDSVDTAQYTKKLSLWLDLSCSAARSEVVWFSVNTIWQAYVSSWCYRFIRDDYVTRKIIWYFTFGQHRESDCGNNYRPIFRIAPQDYPWRMDRVRVPSARQEKYNDKRANPEGRVPGDVWEFPRVCGTFKERRKWHPTQFPEALVERAILMTTDEGDLVIDPFGGTFTTLRVCQRLNRDCIGIDISKTYCRKASEETGVPVEELT